MYRFESDRPLKAFVDIVIEDALLIKGVKILEGKSGLFVSMPQEQAKDKKWYDSVRCLTMEVRDQITQAVLNVYNEQDIDDIIDEQREELYGL
jgi:stage V sporulation protein G